MPRPTGNLPDAAEAEFDLAFPPVPLPATAVMAAVGEPMLRALVRQQHERLRRSSIKNLFPSNPESFAAVVERIATFVVETIDGAPRVAQANGRLWFRTRHLPMTIDETARDVWLAAMLFAFDDVGFPQEARAEFWNWVEALSIRAINRRTTIGQPRRYPLAEAPAALSRFSSAGVQK